MAKALFDSISEYKKGKRDTDGYVRFNYPNNSLSPTLYKVRMIGTHGWQDSPFSDGKTGSSLVEIINLDNGKSLKTADLVASLIDLYGFYEGMGTPYRLDPKTLIEVFPFLGPSRFYMK